MKKKKTYLSTVSRRAKHHLELQTLCTGEYDAHALAPFGSYVTYLGTYLPSLT